MAHTVQNVTLALTLPITCHICLGKVRQPVICANYHVFCSVCIELWLKNNSQCPACRVPITQENPCKNIIGGTSEDESSMTPSGRKHLRKTRLELLQKEYEEEIDSLFKETEELKRANLQLEERLGEATFPAAISIACDCRNKEAVDKRGISDSLLEEWSKKLEMVNAANKKVVEDIETLKEENQRLKNENMEYVRENLRLKNEVDLRSPQKFGRFTVAALQAKVDQYEREMNRLKKALERSDQYVEELEAQVEQLKRPPEDMQKEKSQCGNAAHVQVNNATTTHTCQELNATLQFLSHNYKTGVCSEQSSNACSNSNGHSYRLKIKQSLGEPVGSLGLKGKSSLNSTEQMSIDRKSQREASELAPGFGSPSSSLPFSSLNLNTPGNKGNCSSSQTPLKKPLTYLRRLVFDDLPERKELCQSKSSMRENNLNTVCQIICESGNGTLTGQKDIGLQFGRHKDNTKDQRESTAGLKQSGTFAEDIDKGCHENITELMCNGSQPSNCGNVSGSKQNFQSNSPFNVGKGSGNTASSHQGGEPIASSSCTPCSSSAVGDSENTQYYRNKPAGATQDKPFKDHLPQKDTLSCELSLQCEDKEIFQSASREAECTGHSSQSTWLAHGNLQPYVNSPPAKRKMLNQPSDSPSKSSKP